MQLSISRSLYSVLFSHRTFSVISVELYRILLAIKSILRKASNYIFILLDPLSTIRTFINSTDHSHTSNFLIKKIVRLVSMDFNHRIILI